MSREYVRVKTEKKLAHSEHRLVSHEIFVAPEKNQLKYEITRRNYSIGSGEPTRRFMTESNSSHDGGKMKKIRGAFFSNVILFMLAIGIPVAFAFNAIPMAWEQFGGLGIVGVGLVALWAFFGIATQLFKSLGRYGDLTRDL